MNTTVDTYVIPSVSREVRETVHVSLASFKPEDIAEYLRTRGYQVNGTFSKVVLQALDNKPCRVNRFGEEEEIPGLFISDADLDRVTTLALCGLKAEARDWLVEIVEQHTERSLR